MLTTRTETLAEGVTLYLGDCRSVFAEFPRADAIVTDPPYGFGSYKSDQSFHDLLHWLGSIPSIRSKAVFGYPETLVAWCVASGRIPDEWVTWYPTNKPAGRSGGLPRSSEHVAIFGEIPGANAIFRPRSSDATGQSISRSRGLSSNLAREDDVWRDASPGCGFNGHLRQHPNEKPISVMEKLVGLCSGDGWTILDPFMGSGTTGCAAVKMGRRFIGCEIEPEFYDIARRRISDALARPDLFVEPAARTEPMELPLNAPGGPHHMTAVGVP